MPRELDTHDILFNPARRRPTKPHADAVAARGTAPAMRSEPPAPHSDARPSESPLETPRFAVTRHIGGDEPEPLVSPRTGILIAVGVAAIAAGALFMNRPKLNPPAAAMPAAEPAPPAPAPSPSPKLTAEPAPAPAAPPAASASAVAPASATPAAPKAAVKAPLVAAPRARALPKSDNPYSDTPAPRRAAPATRPTDNPY